VRLVAHSSNPEDRQSGGLAPGNANVRGRKRPVRPNEGCARRIIGTDIKTVEIGWPFGMPLVRKMAPGLWEVRSHLPQGIARVLFTLLGDDLVLLHGFIKKAQKTPATDLALALRRMKEIQRGD